MAVTNAAPPGPSPVDDVEAGVIDDARARQRRQRGIAVVAVVFVAAAVAIGRLASGTTDRPGVAHGAAPQASGVLLKGGGGITYSIGVTPPMKAGVVGWCLAFTEHYPPADGGGGGGGTGCGGTSLGTPFVASELGGFGTRSRSFGDYVYVTTSEVAAVRISPTVTIRTQRDPRLPDADRIAVGIARGSNPVTQAPVPLDRTGAAIPTYPLHSVPSEPSVFWQHRPAPPAVCELNVATLKSAEPTFGGVVQHVHALPHMASGTLVSCAYTSFTVVPSPQATGVQRETVNAAILLNAAHPGQPPGSLPGTTAVANEPGTVNEPASRAGNALAVTARRVGDAWLMIETNGSLASRLKILNDLTTCVRISALPCPSP